MDRRSNLSGDSPAQMPGFSFGTIKILLFESWRGLSLGQRESLEGQYLYRLAASFQ